VHHHDFNNQRSSRGNSNNRDTQHQIPEGLLSTQDTLAALGISEQTLKRRRAVGLIEPVILNPSLGWQQLYYRVEDIERLKRGSHEHTGHTDEPAS